MKIILSITLVFLTLGCSTKEIINSSDRLPSSTKHYDCFEYEQSKDSTPIRVAFDYLKVEEIFNVKVKLKSADSEIEVFSSDNKIIVGTSSKKSAQLLLFSIVEENKDRFDLFANKKTFGSQQFYSTAKVTFDDDASKNIKLNCKLQ
ncbi:MAG: hypothetical protein H7Z71_00520 [Moraxellaceae bacterium]|nr:hypothetical protein [Pseudobdellovibrionaceae bacterium]